MGWSSIKPRWFPKRGSNDGIIIVDEEHTEGARITLERKPHNAPFAITCGIYDWMVHTRFFGDEQVARQALEDMKRDIESILALVPRVDEADLDKKMDAVIAAIGDFVEKHP